MNVASALQGRIAEGLEAAVTKYFDRDFNATVTVEKRGHEILTDCTVHLPSGIVLQSSGTASEAYASLEDSLEKMEKRVRRYHRRLKDHNKRAPLPTEAATMFVIESDEDRDIESEGDAPLIIPESASHAKTMSVSEAVMQLELSETPAVLFRNVKHSGLNMVYRREDGHIAWVDPAAHSSTGSSCGLDSHTHGK